MKIFTIAHVPPDLERHWLQHLRDFDVANPGCHFEVIAQSPDATLTEIVDLMLIHPKLDVMQVIERRREEQATIMTNEQLVMKIIKQLPEIKAEALHILDAARRMVERFKR